MSPAAQPGAPASPCRQVCVIDGTTGLCQGCGRTLDEIAAWPRLDAAGKRRVLATLPGRMAALHGAAGGSPSSQ